MRAVRLIKPGSPLKEEEIEIPPVGAGDVLIRVKGAVIQTRTTAREFLRSRICR